MRNLLSANLLRLRKSGLFWGMLAFCLGFGIFMVFNCWQMNQYDENDSVSLNGAFFIYPIIVSVVLAVFIPLFFGREYSDGAIRNKAAAGYSRLAIYAANLLTGMAVSLLFCVAYMAAVGTPLVGFIVMDARQAVLMILGSLLAVAAFCALFTLIVMTCSRKSVSAVVCVLGVFLMLIASIYVKSRLDSPEYYTNYIANENGIPVSNGLVKNAQYLSGTQRTVFELLYNLLPSSQAVQYASRQAENLSPMPLYALAVIVLCTGVGIILFRRKELK